MRRIITLIFYSLLVNAARAQKLDTLRSSNVTIIMDSRLKELARQEAAFNEAFALAPKVGRGYRLVVLTTSDRNLAQQVRAQLLQRYPDQKAYTVFQSPNIKLKFGNYVEKAEADAVRKEILRNGIVTGNIYIVPEDIEIRPDKKAKETD